MTIDESGDGWELRCWQCGAAHPWAHAARCLKCGGPVLKHRRGPFEYRVDEGAPGIWRYASMLGLGTETSGLSLGESGTPLLRSERLARALGLEDVRVKLDSLCPTGSFKDRAVAGGVDQAVRTGARAVVCASSGNAAASAAAYGARAGLPVILTVPESTPEGKLRASAVYGATQLVVRGDYSDAYRVAEELASELAVVNVTTTYMNPHGVSALRSVAYDLFEQLGGAPDVVLVPTSTGPLVHGVHEGFRDLAAAQLIDRVPRMVASQPAGCSPITRAFELGASRVEEWTGIETRVSGLDDPLRGYASDGCVTLEDLHRSDGTAVGMDDESIEAEREALLVGDGVYAEPAGATSVAGLVRLTREGWIKSSEKVVCLITGHGFKVPVKRDPEPHLVADSREAFDAVRSLGIPRKEDV